MAHLYLSQQTVGCITFHLPNETLCILLFVSLIFQSRSRYILWHPEKKMCLHIIWMSVKIVIIKSYWNHSHDFSYNDIILIHVKKKISLYWQVSYISTAFDMVWHECIAKKMSQMDYPLVLLMYCYLRRRSFCVRLEKKLYFIYITNIPKADIL